MVKQYYNEKTALSTANAESGCKKEKCCCLNYIRLRGKIQMTNEDLIIYQAKKIVELQINSDYWMHSFLELQDKSKPMEALADVE